MSRDVLSALDDVLLNDLVRIIEGYTQFEGIEVNVLKGHTSWVTSLAVLPDGRLASGSHDNTIRIWDLNTSAHICEHREEGDLGTGTTHVLEGHTGCVSSLAVLPDGRLASGSHDNTIRIWDLNMGAHICEHREKGDLATGISQVLEGHTNFVTSLAILLDGRLVSGSYDKTIRIWDLATGTSHVLNRHSNFVISLAALPDGRLASGYSDNTIRIWDLNMGTHICERREESGLATATSQVLEGHTDWVTCLAVLPDGRLVSGSYDKTIRIWDLNMDAAHICEPREQGDLVTSRVLQGHTDWVRKLAVLPDGRLISGSGDKIIRMWDLNTHIWEAPLCAGLPIDTSQFLEGHTGCVSSLAVLSDGCLVSGSYDTTIRIWV